MGTKLHELDLAQRGLGCLGKAAPSEPIFILRGQDLHAPYAVRCWADAAAVMLGDNHFKIMEARKLADQMETWPNRKLPD